MEDRKVILKIEHLCKDFDIKAKSFTGKALKLHALSDISLDIYEGETLGIIGESGCGKSTFGKTLIQLHKATSGSVEYNGRDIFSLQGKELKDLKRDIQMVFQDPYSSLDPRKTAAKIIAEPLVVHKLEPDKKKRDDKVLGLMREVGLDVQHVNRFPHEFSGGQRQRINVARALALNPKLIICDEPVSALDVSIQAQVLNLFNRLQKEYNLTYVFISHDLGVIRHLCSRVIVMNRGKAVEQGSVQEIFEHPSMEYTKKLLAAIPTRRTSLRRRSAAKQERGGA